MMAGTYLVYSVLILVLRNVFVREEAAGKVAAPPADRLLLLLPPPAAPTTPVSIPTILKASSCTSEEWIAMYRFGCWLEVLTMYVVPLHAHLVSAYFMLWCRAMRSPQSLRRARKAREARLVLPAPKEHYSRHKRAGPAHHHCHAWSGNHRAPHHGGAWNHPPVLAQPLPPTPRLQPLTLPAATAATLPHGRGMDYDRRQRCLDVLPAFRTWSLHLL